MNDSAYASTRRKARREFQIMYSPFLLIALGSFLTLEIKEPAKTSELALALSLAYGVSISVMFMLAGRKIAREKDEYQRKLLLQALLCGTVVTLVVSTVWGSLEAFTNVHHMPSILNFGIFIIVFAIAKLSLFRRNLVEEKQ